MAKSAISNLLKANKTAGATKPTSKVPTIEADALHDAVHNAYTAYRDSEAAFRAIEAELLSKSDALYSENALNGTFNKSYNFPGHETVGVQVTYQDRFSAIPVENEENLKAILGKDYDKFFDEKRELQLNDTSDETVELLVKKLGQELFLSLFSIKLTITAKKDMDRNQFDLDESARAYLKQFKASVKLGK